MSPRAACRLDALGFIEVHDYTLGIADWKAAGEPIDGPPVGVQVVADATRPDIPTAGPEELLGTVKDRAEAAGWDEALVLDCGGVVIGRLRGPTWNQDGRTPVVEIMEPGPTTVRPNGALSSLVTRMERHATNLVTVTTPQGVLIGVVLLRDAMRVVTGEPQEQIWFECDGCPGQWKLQRVPPASDVGPDQQARRTVGYGLTYCPPTIMPRWRTFVVAFPVLPTKPTTGPWLTLWPLLSPPG